MNQIEFENLLIGTKKGSKNFFKDCNLFDKKFNKASFWIRKKKKEKILFQ